MRLDLPEFRGRERAQAREAVLPRAALELREGGQLGLFRGDDELAADLMRLDLPEFRGRERAQAREAVLPRAALELREGGQLGLFRGDDELAADLVRDAVSLAERYEQAPAFHAGFRLLGARLVVEARMDDAAVVARLVRGDLLLLLEDHDGEARRALEQLQGCGEAHDAAARDRDVNTRHRQLLRSPRSWNDTTRPRPITTWSFTSMPISRPAATKRCVVATSSGEGSGSPDGWLWYRMTPAAPARMAWRKRGAGATAACVSVPRNSGASFTRRFFASRRSPPMTSCVSPASFCTR